MADISKPPMALFANIPAADIKKSNIVMFAMVSSRYLVAPNEWPPERGPMFRGSISICLQPDVIFDVFAIVDVTNVGSRPPQNPN